MIVVDGDTHSKNLKDGVDGNIGGSLKDGASTGRRFKPGCARHACVADHSKCGRGLGGAGYNNNPAPLTSQQQFAAMNSQQQQSAGKYGRGSGG